MKHLVFNKMNMEFRYGSGMTVYSEYFDAGRLLCEDYHASGMPHNPLDKLEEVSIPSFELEIDGNALYFGWKFVSWTEDSEGGRPRAVITLTHEDLHIELKVVTLCGENGFFTRYLRIKNTSISSVGLTRVSPLAGSIWEQTDGIKEALNDYELQPYEVGYLKDCYWGTEGNFEWRDLPYNATTEIGNFTGRSGHSHPFAIVHNRLFGGYFVAQLEWSSNWKFRFRNDFRHVGMDAWNPNDEYIRMAFSIAPESVAPMRIIKPGEEIETPKVHYGFLFGNFDDAINALHDYQRAYLLAKPYGGYARVQYNHWGYMRHELSEDKLMAEIDKASDIGAEVFVVDAGWYGRVGSQWELTVGDWKAGPRLPRDLTPISDYAHKKGMGFGLWAEIEAIGSESLLIKEHPEWLYTRYGKTVERCLDLANPEVEAWLESEVLRMIEQYKLDLFRLDYNNWYLYEGGFTKHDGFNENSHWRHVEAIHRIFDHVRQKHPELILENCASGGGRTDLGMLTRFSQTQCSDIYKLPRIARTINGLTMCLPPEHLLCWYGEAMAAQKYSWAEPQMQIMCIGIPYISGLAPEGEAINPWLYQRLKEYVRMYKDFVRPIQRSVKVYHHTPVVPGLAGRGWAAYEFMVPDGSRGYANVFRLPNAKGDTFNIRFRGVDATKKYALTFVTGNRKAIVDGFELSNTGLNVLLDGPLTSQMILLETINDARG